MPTTLQINGGRAVLTARVSPALMQLVQTLEGRRSWLRSGSLSFEASPGNLAKVKQIPDLVVTENKQDPLPLKLAKRGAYKSNTEPFPHQVEAIAKAKTRNTIALFMEQGTGKSKCLIDWAGELFMDGEITGVIVVSKKGVHRQWAESEIPTHLGVPFRTAWWKMKPKAWREFIDEPSKPDRLDFACWNYDGLKTKGGLDDALRFCQKHHRRVLVIADESQDIKNARSQRHAAMSKLVPWSSHRALATGTPIAKDLTDEWAQLKWLDESILGIRYVSSFRNYFCLMGGFENKQVIGHKNIDKFKEMTAPAIYRATKDDIGILPKQYATWHIDLAPEQARAIKELKRDLITRLDSGEIVSAANMVAAMTKFGQIAAGFAITEDETPQRLLPDQKNPRLIGLLDYLADGNNARAVVWHRFRYEHEMIAAALATNGVSFVSYYGATSDRDRADAVRRFCTEDGPQVFLANPQSAGTGLNLQGYCNRAIYWSNSFNAIDRWQSEDRIHRIGTKGIVTYTDMVAEGTLDAYILKNLKRKKGLSDLVLSDLRSIVKEM